VYYKSVKFHKNPISGLGGVALTRYMEGRTDGQGDSDIPPILCMRWYNELNVIPVMYSTRSFSYVIARASNNDMNMKHVM
jgi:hypothetical protein